MPEEVVITNKDELVDIVNQIVGSSEGHRIINWLNAVYSYIQLSWDSLPVGTLSLVQERLEYKLEFTSVKGIDDSINKILNLFTHE